MRQTISEKICQDNRPALQKNVKESSSSGKKIIKDQSTQASEDYQKQ